MAFGNSVFRNNTDAAWGDEDDGLYTGDGGGSVQQETQYYTDPAPQPVQQPVQQESPVVQATKQMIDMGVINDGMDVPVKYKSEELKSGDAIIAGEVTLSCDVNCKGALTIDGGTVNGNVSANTLVLNGVIKGSVKVKDSVTVTKISALTGDISAASINIEPGAKISGNIKINVPDAPKNKAVRHEEVPDEKNSVPGLVEDEE